jgi:hypothetical protein
MARLWASDMAIDRFNERFCPGYPRSRARRELLAIAEQARKTDERAPRGEEIWRGGTDGEVMLVVKQDRRRGMMPTIVTVVRDGVLREEF